MPRKRLLENKGLPQRWRFKNNAYYYAVPKEVMHLWDNKQLFRLGKTLSEAYRKWSERVESVDNIKYVKDLISKYEIEVIPLKAPKTQTNNITALPKLRAVFGDMLPHEVLPSHIYKFIDKIPAKRVARMAIALLSHIFTKGVEWGVIDRHPFKGEVRIKYIPAKKKHYITDFDFNEALSLKPRGPKDWITRMMRAYIKLKRVTAMRMTDMLCLQPHDLKDDGLYITPSKTENSSGKTMIIKRSHAVVEAFLEALAARPVHIAPWVFCTRRGKCYFNEKTGETSGFSSLWQRWMKRVLAETNVSERFSERDIRAKTASDIERLDDASALLGHTDTRTTRKHYRRRPEIVNPLK